MNAWRFRFRRNPSATAKMPTAIEPRRDRGGGDQDLRLSEHQQQTFQKRKRGRTPFLRRSVDTCHARFESSSPAPSITSPLAVPRRLRRQRGPAIAAHIARMERQKSSNDPVRAPRAILRTSVRQPGRAAGNGYPA